MPDRVCSEPRCPDPATYRGRCPEHARTNNQATHSNTEHRAIYNSKRWAILRRRVISEQPICAGCDNALSVDVDHITPLAEGGQPYARDNVQGLCRPCHSSKTRREQGNQIHNKILPLRTWG
jgi:5-methylcytosine-specific restriction protein A